MAKQTQKKSRGLVLRTTNFSEADRYCSILTPDLGLIEARARGARRNRSSLMLTTEFLSLADFELFDYKDRYTINSADLVYAFPRIREDVERLTCASHLSELLRDLLLPEEVSQELYELMARALAALEKDSPPLLATVHACELRLMKLSGYGLELGRCVHCQTKLAADEAACFDFSMMGLTCRTHRPTEQSLNSPYQPLREKPAMDLSAAALAAIDWFTNAALPGLFSFESTAEVVAELDRFCRQYLAWNLDKTYTKLDMLRLF